MRKENYDLQTLTFSEKNAKDKLNSVLIELNNYIQKIEKAYNIKAYYMMPLRELLSKFEQIMKASEKSFAEFEKKNEKKDVGEQLSPSRLQRKLSMRKIPSQYK